MWGFELFDKKSKERVRLAPRGQGTQSRKSGMQNTAGRGIRVAVVAVF
jgi:hypothetical protein